MNCLEVIDLHVEVEGKEIIKGVSLVFHLDKIHALMGPNGSGKTTLAYAIMGHPQYTITHGKIMIDGRDITHEKPEVRAKLGLFLSFQYPTEISGVTLANFLRTAVNARREKPHSVVEFYKLLQEKMSLLKMDTEFSRRYVNAGFSGGEKKRAEMLQLLVLNPRYAFLDETDSGLDIDAIKIVAQGIQTLRRNFSIGIIAITHYHRFLEYLKPDQVSVLYEGKIISSGGAELAEKIEQEGFEGVIRHAV